MNITIDTAKLDKLGLSINDYLTILQIHSRLRSKDINYVTRPIDYMSLRDRGYLSIRGSNISLTEKGANLIESKSRDYVTLAEQIRELFPKGRKDDKYPWRGTLRILSDRLKKLDKSFGLSAYSDQAIIDATKEYTSKFIMDYTGMRICPYFLLKDGGSDLMAWLENEDEEEETNDKFVTKL